MKGKIYMTLAAILVFSLALVACTPEPDEVVIEARAKQMAEEMAKDMAPEPDEAMVEKQAMEMAEGMAQEMAEGMAQEMAEEMAMDMAKDMAKEEMMEGGRAGDGEEAGQGHLRQP